MNEHEEVRELLALAASGILEPDDERRVREHVRACPECAAELDSLRCVGEWLSELPIPQPSPELLARTRALVGAELAGTARHHPMEALMAAFAIFGWLVMFATWLTYRLFRAGAGAVTQTNWSDTAAWLAGSSMLAWMTAGAVIIIVGRNRRPERSL